MKTPQKKYQKTSYKKTTKKLFTKNQNKCSNIQIPKKNVAPKTHQENGSKNLRTRLHKKLQEKVSLKTSEKLLKKNAKNKASLEVNHVRAPTTTTVHTSFRISCFISEYTVYFIPKPDKLDNFPQLGHLFIPFSGIYIYIYTYII